MSSEAVSRRGSFATAVAFVTALALGACGPAEPAENPTSRTPPGASPGMVIHPAPAGTAEDPLAGLPSAASSARLLVSTVDDGVPLEVLDLEERSSAGISGIPGGGLQQGAFTPEGGVAFVAGPRSIGFVEPDGRRRPGTADLPAGVPGEITTLAVAGNVVVAGSLQTDQGAQRPGRSVLFELDGRHRCDGPEGTQLSWFRAGWLWSPDLRSRIDPATCAAMTGLELRGYEGPLFFLTAGPNGYLSSDGYSVSRFDLATGKVQATSPAQKEPITHALLRDDLWVLAGSRLLTLDPATLRVTASKRVLECAYNPSLLEARGRLYLLDDCQAALYRLEPSSGNVVEGWALPVDGESDVQVYGVPTGEGIWFVDVEQSGKPYFFDPVEARFERLPLDPQQAEPVYALVFDVHPRSPER
ncbi:MAG TPA: hypothetical protein VHJ78_01270 [Actinomycetota bacterium]|nr:hypothetical protein [Actinomycetota bacterium]